MGGGSEIIYCSFCKLKIQQECFNTPNLCLHFECVEDYYNATEDPNVYLFLLSRWVRQFSYKKQLQ